MNPGYLDSTPAVPPPPGHDSNFTNPESRCYELVIVITVFACLIVIVLILRIYLRLKITRSFGADDCMCTTISVETAFITHQLLYQGCVSLRRLDRSVLPRASSEFSDLVNGLDSHPILLCSHTQTLVYLITDPIFMTMRLAKSSVHSSLETRWWYIGNSFLGCSPFSLHRIPEGKQDSSPRELYIDRLIGYI